MLAGAFNLCYSLADISSVRVGCLATTAGLSTSSGTARSPSPRLQPGLCRVLWETGRQGRAGFAPQMEFQWFGREGRRRCGFFATPSFAQGRHFHRHCGAGTGREGPTRLYVPLPASFPSFPSPSFLLPLLFLPDSVGNFSLSLQSSQPLLTHCLCWL